MLVVAAQTHAATVELGKYRAIDADTKSVVATFELKADGTVDFQVKSPDISPAIVCSGKYTVTGSGYFGKGAQMGLRKIGVQVTITDQLHTFVMIDSKLESGYVIPTPWIIAAGATTSTRFFTTDIESFLKLRFLLKRVEPMPT